MDERFEEHFAWLSKLCWGPFVCGPQKRQKVYNSSPNRAGSYFSIFLWGCYIVLYAILLIVRTRITIILPSSVPHWGIFSPGEVINMTVAEIVEVWRSWHHKRHCDAWLMWFSWYMMIRMGFWSHRQQKPSGNLTNSYLSHGDLNPIPWFTLLWNGGVFHSSCSLVCKVQPWMISSRSLEHNGTTPWSFEVGDGHNMKVIDRLLKGLGFHSLIFLWMGEISEVSLDFCWRDCLTGTPLFFMVKSPWLSCRWSLQPVHHEVLNSLWPRIASLRRATSLRLHSGGNEATKTRGFDIGISLPPRVYPLVMTNIAIENDHL